MGFNSVFKALKALWSKNILFTKKYFCNVMHIIMIAICVSGPTASSPWLDAVDLFYFKQNFTAVSNWPGFAYCILTVNYIVLSGVVLTNTCS